MSGTDGTDAAHREPHQDVGCGLLDIMQARRGPFQLSLRKDPGFPLAVSPMSRLPRPPMRRIVVSCAWRARFGFDDAERSKTGRSRACESPVLVERCSVNA